MGISLAGGAFYWQRSRADSFLSTPLANVEFKNNYTLIAEGQGEIHPITETFLTVNLSGRLDSILVHEGDFVHKGQILALIDEMSQTAQLRSALSNFKFAQKEYSRVKSLVHSDSATVDEYDTVNSKLAVAKAALQDAREKFEFGIVRATMDGIVSVIAFAKGDFVPAGSRTVELADESAFKVTVSMSKEFAESLPKSADIQMSPFDARTLTEGAPVKAHATISLAQAANPMIDNGLDVTFSFGSLPPSFKVGDGVRVRLPAVTYRNAALVSERYFIKNDDGKKALIVDQDNHLSWFTPVFGLTSGDKQIVLNLDEETQVIDPEEMDIKGIISKNLAVKIRKDTASL